jgi:hypothetical protein
MRPRLLMVAAVLACWSGEAFGEIDCNKRCGNDYKSGCYDRCRADRGAEQKEALRQSDPKLAAAVEKRFRQIEEIELADDDPLDLVDLSLYTKQDLGLRCRAQPLEVTLLDSSPVKAR